MRNSFWRAPRTRTRQNPLSATFKADRFTGGADFTNSNVVTINDALALIEMENKRKAQIQRRLKERQQYITGDERRAQLFRVANAIAHSGRSKQKVKLAHVSIQHSEIAAE